MAVSLPNDHKIRFYGSPNLRDWKPLSDFGPEGAVGGQWECPELFALPVDGKPANTRWVLKVGLNPGGLAGGSGEQYFIGRFDGSRFINDNPAPLTLWTDYGKDCYCGLTFSNLPPGQKQVMIGWMSNWQYAAKVPTHPWRGQMTVPRELSLRTTPDGIRLYQNPSAALQALRQPFAKGQTTELESTLQFGAAKKVGWKVLADDGTYTLIGYDRDRQQLFTDRTKSGQVAFNKDFPARTTAPLTVSGKQVQLRLLIDQSSVEVFAEDGRLTMTSLVYPNPGATRVEPYAEGGKAGPVTSKMWSLRSIWP
jgi:sucrose-6-phosphate hydrolase SacC (GH32 family)